MDDVKLLPCPICGAEPRIIEWPAGEGRKEYSVRCDNGLEQKTHALQTWAVDKKENAVKLWNTRMESVEDDI